MRISDWSSDVCSSDLGAELWAKSQLELVETEDEEFIDFLLFVVKEGTSVPVIVVNGEGNIQATKDLDSTRTFKQQPAGTALSSGKSLKYDPDYFRQQDRKSVVEGKSVTVRVDLGGRRIIKKQMR